jgi:GTPase SAR1 family protein
MEIYKVQEIFTPTSRARANYLDRQPLHDKMYDALTTPGMQLVIYGESGAGKTTLLRRKLEDFEKEAITTPCTKNSTYESILFDAFDRLGATVVQEVSSEAGQKARTSLTADLKVIKGLLEGTIHSSSTTKEGRILPPQLTPQRLATMLGALGMHWVVEDFHKVTDDVKESIAQVLKLFCDAAEDSGDVRMVLVGAVESAHQVVKADKEMRHRISEVEVPVLEDHELHALIDQGAGLLNADMSRVADEIVNLSSGLAKVCHRLALTSCRNAGIYETSEERTLVTAEHLRMAVTSYISSSSDSLRAIFDDAVGRKRVRKYDNGGLIIRALAAGPKGGMNHAELLAAIRVNEPQYLPSNLTNYLQRLTQGEEPILRKVGTAQYRFAEPLYRSYAQFRFHGEVQIDKDLEELFKELEDSWVH